MYPDDYSNFIVMKTLTKSLQFTASSSESEDEFGGVMDLDQSNFFQEMVHVALRIRQDMIDAPRHSSTQNGIEQVIPDNLYLFHCFLYGGIDVV